MKKRILIVMICLMAGFTKLAEQTNCEDPDSSDFQSVPDSADLQSVSTIIKQQPA